MFERAIIVGASSGMGAEIARLLAVQGCRVALVARRADELAKIAEAINARNPGVEPHALTYTHDVTDYESVPALLQEICRDLGGLDLFIYASGTLPRVAPDEYSFEKDSAMVSVNLLGAIAWCNEVARRFAAAGRGTLVGIGSVAGDRGRRTQSPVYSATKAALDTYLESLRNRLAPHGARVVTIKPGPVSTPMTEGMGRMPFMIPATEAASEILRALERGDTTAYVPGKWRVIMGVIRNIPSPIFRKLNV